MPTSADTGDGLETAQNCRSLGPVPRVPPAPHGARAKSSAQGLGVRLAANDLDLDLAQRLVTFLKSQPDLSAPTYVPLPY
jgi:hypothetical protein